MYADVRISRSALDGQTEGQDDDDDYCDCENGYFILVHFFLLSPVLLLLQMIMSIDVHRRRRCLMSPVLLLRDTQMELFSAIAGDPNGNAATVDWKVIVGLPPGVGPADKK